MGIKRSIKNLIMRYDFTRKIYSSWLDYKTMRDFKHSRVKYKNMTRREIFSHIYRNFTLGVLAITTLAKAPILIFLLNLTANSSKNFFLNIPKLNALSI